MCFSSDVVGVVGVSVSDAATQSAQVGVAPCHNLLEEVHRDNQQLWVINSAVLAEPLFNIHPSFN